MTLDKSYYIEYLKTKFVSAREAHKIIRENGLKFRFGALSKTEVEILKKVMKEFMEKRKLTLADLQIHLAEGSEFPIHDLTEAIAKSLEFRTYKTVHTHISFIYHPYVYSKWEGDEELHLIDLVGTHGFKWKSIAERISKYRDACRFKYLRLKGEIVRNINSKVIKRIIDQNEIPKTEEEWNELALKLKTTRKCLNKRINEHFKKMTFKSTDNHISSVEICLYVLCYNHFCCLNFDIKAIIGLLKSIDIKEIEIENKKIEGLVNNSENALNSSVKASQAEHDQAKENKFQKYTVFLKEKVNNLLKIPEDFNLNVEISDDDIFWSTIFKITNLTPSFLKSEFNILKTSNEIKTFKNVYELIDKLINELFFNKLKCQLIQENIK